MLEVLNIGNNKINDTFPCWLENSSSLHVLVLRWNILQGGIRCLGGNKHCWPNVQIIDLAFNNLSGDLPPIYFSSWRAMMVDEDNAPSKLDHLHFEFLKLNHFYYQDTVTVTNKGLEMELVKILTIFTCIDFSNNYFQGEIPDTVRNLSSLYVLNLSNNALTGPIPSLIGNLRQLGSLDLSRNKLNGNIPLQLASLTFLSFLNLSWNLLVGMIPKGPQIQTFIETSFEGNEGLCGPPLNTNCNGATLVPPTVLEFKPDRDSFLETGIYIIIAIGFVTGLGIIVGPLVFCKRWRKWFWKHVDRVLLRNFLRQQERRRTKRRAYRNPIRRL